jgi:hypothetical protein
MIAYAKFTLNTKSVCTANMTIGKEKTSGLRDHAFMLNMYWLLR